MTELAQALKYIHERQVYHGDIAAKNLLLSNLGRIKLSDFFLFVLEQKAVKSWSETVVATPIHLAPGVADGIEGYDAGKSDMWAAGCVLLELGACEPLAERLLSPRSAEARIELLRRNTGSALLETVARELLVTDPAKRLGANDMLYKLQATLS